MEVVKWLMEVENSSSLLENFDGAPQKEFPPFLHPHFLPSSLSCSFFTFLLFDLPDF